ncbi:MAG: succinylglutamate desuccinylase/aspartoacylase family protein [bacterium]|nr:succinylglutamate desuccinylase/aspartoacylase family protein [bacterium]
MTGFAASHLRSLPGLGPESRRLPLLEARAERPGPTIWLTACMHGDEVGGMAVVHELFKALKRWGLLCGKVMALPMVNPVGFEARRRELPYTGEDLNRCFPGNPAASLGRRHAFAVFDWIMKSKPELVLDLHNDWNRSIPYGLTEPGETPAHQKARDYLAATGLLAVEDIELIEGALAPALLDAGVPALTLELGESHLVNEQWVRLGLERIWALMAQMEMVVPQKAAEALPIGELDRRLVYSNRPWAPASGIIRYLVAPGAWVKARQPLARIYDPLGRSLALLKAEKAGVLLGHADSAVVFAGMPVFAFGTGLPVEMDRQASRA